MTEVMHSVNGGGDSIYLPLYRNPGREARMKTIRSIMAALLVAALLMAVQGTVQACDEYPYGAGSDAPVQQDDSDGGC
jgi:hypothetical protein